MKTDELIHLLAADERPVQRTAIEQRFAVASAAGKRLLIEHMQLLSARGAPMELPIAANGAVLALR